MLHPLANPPTHERTERFIATTKHCLDAPAPVRFWHLASLDAPTIAVVWSLSFAWAFRVRLPAWVPVLLALGTWTVYIGDRMLDARSAFRRGEFNGLRDRHYFHWRHRRVLVPLVFSAAAIAAMMIFILIPVGARRPDSVLAAAAMAYFSGVHIQRPRTSWLTPVLSKEFLVGTLFTAGCILPIFSRLRFNPGHALQLSPVFLIAVYFASLAWLNCHAIDCWESGSSSGLGFNSNLLGISGLVLAAFIGPAQPRVAALLAAGSLSALLLALLHRYRGRMTPVTLRAAADLVLLAPAFLLLQ
jgi:hypothetical protein